MLDALDGALVLYLLVAGGLTLVVGALALTIFKRAVARYMQAADGGPAGLLLERWHALDSASPNHLLQPAHLLVLDAADTNSAVVLYLLAIAGGGQEASSEPVSVLTSS
jgi:hypothetical protein